MVHCQSIQVVQASLVKAMEHCQSIQVLGDTPESLIQAAGPAEKCREPRAHHARHARAAQCAQFAQRAPRTQCVTHALPRRAPCTPCSPYVSHVSCPCHLRTRRASQSLHARRTPLHDGDPGVQWEESLMARDDSCQCRWTDGPGGNRWEQLLMARNSAIWGEWSRRQWPSDWRLWDWRLWECNGRSLWPWDCVCGLKRCGLSCVKRQL